MEPLAGLPSACVAVAVRFALVPSFLIEATSLAIETEPFTGLTVVLLQADAKAAIAATVSALNSIFTGSSRAGMRSFAGRLIWRTPAGKVNYLSTRER